MELLRITDRLVRRLRRLRFGPPVACVYNPLVYARAQYDAYLERYGRKRPREIVLLGMNPGPWGMVQTGVPFGEISIVRDWLGLREPIGRPRCEHPARPILGLECPRSEVSGARLWGWARDRFQTPERFFERFFVANYCPLAFVEESGRNRTPDKLPAAEREPLLAACDEALRDMLAYFQPRLVIGIGAFAESRARAVLAPDETDGKAAGRATGAPPRPVRDASRQPAAAARRARGAPGRRASDAGGRRASDAGGRRASDAASRRASDATGRRASGGAAPDHQAIRIGRILHPSPASPAANGNWTGTIERQLRELGVAI